MLSSAEIARGSQGAVKFLLRDVSAPFHFDNTLEGCLRSFRVMILVAPIYAFVRVIEYMQVNVAADPGQIVLVEGLRYVVEWLLYPVIFHEIARRRGWLVGVTAVISASSRSLGACGPRDLAIRRDRPPQSGDAASWAASASLVRSVPSSGRARVRR